MIKGEFITLMRMVMILATMVFFLAILSVALHFIIVNKINEQNKVQCGIEDMTR